MYLRNEGLYGNHVIKDIIELIGIIRGLEGPDEAPGGGA